MHADATKSSPTDKNDVRDIAVDLYPFLRKYKDGRVERFLRSSWVSASEDTGATRGVSTRDVVIDRDTGVSARLFLPTGAAAAGRRLPLVVYIHGGAFCTESAFCRTYHRYATSLASRAGALVASVEYRLAPEHPVPAAYDDAWTALQWVASLADPWLAAYADPRRMFLAGDSAGGNIAYHTAARASCDGNGMDIEGLVIVHPYFWGAERLPSETVWDGVAVFPPERVDRLWPFVTVGQAGNDDPRIDPPDEEIASLTCRRSLVAVAGKDTLRDRGLRLAARMRNCGLTGGNVTLVESEGEDHGFHLYSPLRATSKKLMESIVQFINQSYQTPPPPTTVLAELHEWSTWKPSGTMGSAQTIISVPSRPYTAVLVDGPDMKDCGGPISMVHNASPAGRGKASKTSYGSYLGQLKPNKAHQNLLSVAVPWRTVMKNFL